MRHLQCETVGKIIYDGQHRRVKLEREKTVRRLIEKQKAARPHFFPELRQNRPAFVREKMLVNGAEDDEIVFFQIFRQSVAARRLKKFDVFEIERFGAFPSHFERRFDKLDAGDFGARKHSRENVRRSAAAAAEFKNRFIFKIFAREVGENVVFQKLLDIFGVFVAPYLVTQTTGAADFKD